MDIKENNLFVLYKDSKDPLIKKLCVNELRKRFE